MRTTYDVLIMGASYGSLLAAKLLLAKPWWKLHVPAPLHGPAPDASVQMLWAFDDDARVTTR